MTKAQTIDAIRKIHPALVAKWKADYGEYRVSISHVYYMNNGMSYKEAIAKNEAVAYYTSDPEDAIGTAKAMIESLLSTVIHNLHN